MCTSTKPGIAVKWVAFTSCAPLGELMSRRGPMASITPSRIRIPASRISVVGVSARAVCSKIVVMGRQHPSGNRADGKTGETETSPVRELRNAELLGLRCHLDAGQLEGVSVDRAFHGDVMAGVVGNFRLVVDRVDLFVAIVDEDVFRAGFHALDGAFTRSVIGSLRAALAVSDIPGPATISSDGNQARRQKGDCRNCCNS